MPRGSSPRPVCLPCTLVPAPELHHFMKTILILLLSLTGVHARVVEYDLYGARSLGSLFGVAIHKLSPHYDRMKKIMADKKPVHPDQYDR